MNMASMQMGQPKIPVPNAPGSKAPMLHTLELTPFVDPLPLPTIVRPTLRNGRRTVTVSMQEIHAKVHRDVPPTRMWSYGSSTLAPLIEARG